LDRLLHVTGLHQAFTISGETKTDKT